jgi:hypothetical protein
MTTAAQATEKLAGAADVLVELLRRQERRELDELRRRRDEEAERRGYVSQPRRFGIDLCFRRFPGFAAEFARIVPPEFWSVDRRAAIIACPCKHEPVVELGLTTTCECGRAYLYTGDTVRVAFSPAKEPAAS